MMANLAQLYTDGNDDARPDGGQPRELGEARANATSVKIPKSSRI